MGELWLIVTMLDGTVMKYDVCLNYNTPESTPYTPGGRRFVVYKTPLYQNYEEAMANILGYVDEHVPQEIIVYLNPQ